MKKETTKRIEGWRALLHFKHKWRSAGWRMWGDYTEWYRKCDECETTHSTFDVNYRPLEITGLAMFYIISFLVAGFLIFAYLYVNNII